MKIGDKVKLIRIPPNLKDDEKLGTRSLFEKCLGKAFLIVGLDSVEGLSDYLVQLDVGHVLGKSEYMESILGRTRILAI